MACCGGKKSSGTYYANNFSVATTNSERYKKCEYDSKDLLVLHRQIGQSANLTDEQKRVFRHMVALWHNVIATECPDVNKVKEIKERIDGTYSDPLK